MRRSKTPMTLLGEPLECPICIYLCYKQYVNQERDLFFYSVFLPIVDRLYRDTMLPQTCISNRLLTQSMYLLAPYD